MYGCDWRWWRQNNGVPEFKGLKLSQDGDACIRYPRIHKVTLDKNTDRLLLDRPGVVASGSHGGCQVLNLVLQFASRFIVLVGYDMAFAPDGAAHWHGDHPRGLGNPRAGTLETWRKHLDAQAGWMQKHGVTLINASAQSALRAYPKMTLDAALERFESCRSRSA